jgi:hypothetical protein
VGGGEELWKNLQFFYDSSPTSARTKMFPQFFPGRRRGPQSLSTILPQFFSGSRIPCCSSLPL